MVIEIGGMFVFGLVLLLYAADHFVRAAASLARAFNVSDFVIGITIVAIGTSLPEISSGIIASLAGESGFVLGSVVGSNMVNMCLIAGVAAVITPLKTKTFMIKRDGKLLLLALLFLVVVSLSGEISRTEAIILLLVYVMYAVILIQGKRSSTLREMFEDVLKMDYLKSFVHEVSTTKNELREHVDKKVLIKQCLMLPLAMVGVVLGAKLMVENALLLGDIIGANSFLLSMTVVAMGNALPEMAVSFAALKKGYADLLLGNVLGSNIANTLLITGTAALVSPIAVSNFVLLVSLPIVLISAIVFLNFMRKDWALKRTEGIFLLCLYVFFLVITAIIAGTP